MSDTAAEIRQALRDERRKIVQTVPKVGYRIAETVLSVPGRACTTTVEKIPYLKQNPVRFVTADDGTRIAWTASGRAIPMLKAPSWISNLKMEAQSLLFTNFYSRLGELVHLVRFDQRGTGLSGACTLPLTVDAMVEDMRAVADAAGLKQFLIYGPSQGVAFAIAFAHRYPDRVLGIIGRGVSHKVGLPRAGTRRKQNMRPAGL